MVRASALYISPANSSSRIRARGHTRQPRGASDVGLKVEWSAPPRLALSQTNGTNPLVLYYYTFPSSAPSHAPSPHPMSALQPGPLAPPCPPRPVHVHGNSTWTDDEDLSSDDDEAVFFGAHKPEEVHLVAKLSAAVQSPAPFIPRVKKRDSREFLRRKTLLLPTDKRNQKNLNLSAQDSARLYPSQWSDDEGSCSTPARSGHPASASTPSQAGQDPSDLTLKFETWHLSTPRDDESESAEEASDKENVPVPPCAGVQGPVDAVPLDELYMERQGILDLQGSDQGKSCLFACPRADYPYRHPAAQHGRTESVRLFRSRIRCDIPRSRYPRRVLPRACRRGTSLA